MSFLTLSLLIPSAAFSKGKKPPDEPEDEEESLIQEELLRRRGQPKQNAAETLPQESQDFDRLPALTLALQLKRSDDGLIFTYGEHSTLRTAKILNSETEDFIYFSPKDSELIKTGLPSQLLDEETKNARELYRVAQKQPSLDNLGLSRFGLGGALYLASCWSGLDSSLAGGRGSLVRCGATRADFQNYTMQEINAEHEAEVTKLNKKKEKVEERRDRELAKARELLEAQ